MAQAIADMVAAASAQATQATTPGVVAAQAKDREAFLEHMEKVLAPAIKPLLTEMIDHPDTPPEIKALLSTAAEPTHFVQVLPVIVSTIFLLQPAVQAAAVSLLTQLEQVSWANHPVKVLPAAEAAEAVLKGVWDRGRGVKEAHASGYEADRFDVMVATAGNPPGLEQLIEMLRRGVIGDDEFRKGVRQGNTRTEWADELRALKYETLSAPAAVQAAVEGALPHDVARRKADLAGTTGDDFETLFAIAGNPPGLGEALELLRRGKLSEAEVRKVIAESNTKTKYADALLELRYQIPTTSQALQGEVEGQLSGAQARAAFARAGGNPADYEWLFGVAGDPIAPGQTLDLWNRELLTEADVDQIMLESTIKPKWIDTYKKLAIRIPPLEQTGMLMRRGVWTQAEGETNLRHLGFAPDMAAALAEMYAQDEAAGDVEFAKGEVRALYRASLIDRQRAAELLVALGKTDEYAQFMLDLDDAVKARQRLDRNINVVRTKYLAFRIDDAEASETLDAIGVQPEARTDYLDEWGALREVTMRDLTEAQVGMALKRGSIDAADYLQRLARMGYSEADAQLLLANRGGGAGGGDQ